MSHQKYTQSEVVFILAHGAGAGKDSDWMITVDNLLTAQGLEVVRFNFPYMIKSSEDGKRRPPDRQPKLLEAFKAQLALVNKNQKIIVGGKSMGGRMASLLSEDDALANKLAGIVCFGFPFHPPGKPEKYRGEHLQHVNTPTLILQGERDTFGSKQEVKQFRLGQKVTLEFLPDGDHSFKPRVKSGYTLEANLALAAEKVGEFVDNL